MTIIEFFNPHEIEHLKAYRHLEKKGVWPKKFSSKLKDEFGRELIFPNCWQVGVAGKMAAAWLNAAELGKIIGMSNGKRK